MKISLSQLQVPALLLLAFFALRPSAVVAQTAGRRTSIGLNASTLQYQGDFGSDYWKFDNNLYAPGLAINQYLTRGLDLNTQVFYGQLTGRRNAATHFTTTLINTNLGFKLKLNNGWALKENFPIQPYLLVASGWTYAGRTGMMDGARIDEKKGYVDVMAGAGINLRLGGVIGLFVQSSQHLPMYANLDGIPTTNSPRWADRFLQHTVGLTFNLGRLPDADEDGVPDGPDQCPHTPEGVEVNARGCPLDDDSDGVPNYQDQCPSDSGSVALHGCPDADQDGVDDTDDACPDVPGKPELHGCPDTDNDGIADSEDKCPDTPAGATVDTNGCPVGSLPTASSPAPSAPALTDTDGDGVPNDVDRCPDRAGPATNHGCPELQATARQRLKQATGFIGFERNKATLLSSSYPMLDSIANILDQYPDYTLSIAGHTDSQGPAAFNLRLSRERAAAARRYLLDKGAAANRVELRGYGPRHPLASNATETGRTQNRRVEFDLFLTGDPNAAQVKYGTEPTYAPVVTPAKKPATLKKAVTKKAPAKTATSRKAPVNKKPTSTTKTRKLSKPQRNTSSPSAW